MHIIITMPNTFCILPVPDQGLAMHHPIVSRVELFSDVFSKVVLVLVFFSSSCRCTHMVKITDFKMEHTGRAISTYHFINSSPKITTILGSIPVSCKNVSFDAHLLPGSWQTVYRIVACFSCQMSDGTFSVNLLLIISRE